MDREFEEYAAGRTDGLAAHRDGDRAGHTEFGRDYRIGFLDGRLEVFRMLASVRKIVEDD
ncbi:hypothetical protein [Paractinoplanes durhamensis]|uniref:Uncharacterized protein n=1 Tax=Paractinoplanes durhamensis TaxID=113563 RepID=A0ABQ3YU56_9ACTN|nr:hypothetical protein [Actinoplanes durhamensis]GIE01014.1 hypothetical protein Adu01nite_23640 [Actinoplanes durhamensis]